MHDLKPLILPKLVAARKSSKSSLKMSDDSALSVYSSADSGFYSASECSTPPTPSLPMRGHFRFPSSTSSLSSSPPTHDPIDSPNGSAKLPKLTEEPVERDVDYAGQDPYRCYCDIDVHSQECRIRRAYDPEEEYFTHCDSELRQAKRRRSLETSANSMSGKLERRFSSFSRKVRERSSNLSKASRSAPPSMVPSTRSSSLAGSIHLPSTVDLHDEHSSPAPPRKESLENNSPMPTPIDIEKANAIDINPEQVQAERYATTPLLPPLLVSCRAADVPASSPLQSPTIADVTHSVAPTPMSTPPVRAYPTPSLSSKPSIASFKAPRPGYTVSSADIPPMMLADPNDKWANMLGHANFTILPEPYVPDVCNAASVQQQFNDWVEAQRNYAKHQVRTAEHYGITSKYYLLSEQKWAEVHAEWRQSHDLAKAQAAAIGQVFASTSPIEPGPLSTMPMLNDPKSEGKFPKLGDEDIVGPMQQGAAILPRSPSRKRALFRFLNDLFVPRSSSIRSH